MNHKFANRLFVRRV